MFRIVMSILLIANFLLQGMQTVHFLQYERKMKEFESLFEEVDIFDKNRGNIEIFVHNELVPFMKKKFTAHIYKDLFAFLQTHQGCMLFVECIHRKNHWNCDHSNLLKTIREFVPIAQTIYDQHSRFRNSFVLDRSKQMYTDQDFNNINPNYSWHSNGIDPTCLLVAAADKNNLSLFRALLQRGADPNPWLISLFQQNSMGCLNYLLACKSILKKENIFHYFALERNYIDDIIVEKTKLLLELGIDKDLTDNLNQQINVINDFTKPKSKRKRDQKEIENCSKILFYFQAAIDRQS